MNFSNNLHFLRKRDKVTQEELAERLGVSRQSVSKWETGDAYPETDKLILLCDIFHVSLDDMIRDDLTVAQNDPPDAEQSRCDTREEFIAHMNKFSKLIALGVFFILFSIGICVAFCGFGMMLKPHAQELTSILGAVVVITMVAFAVFFFIVAGTGHDRFRKEHAEIASAYTEAEINAFEKRFAVIMASLVAGILIDVAVLVTFTSLFDAEIIPSTSSDAAQCFVVSAFFVILASLVSLIVYFGIQHSKFDVDEYNKETRESSSDRQKLKNCFGGVIMLVAVAVFLLVGFIWNKWHPGWIAFPIGGILCAIVSTIIDAKK